MFILFKKINIENIAPFLLLIIKEQRERIWNNLKMKADIFSIAIDGNKYYSNNSSIRTKYLRTNANGDHATWDQLLNQRTSLIYFNTKLLRD